MDSQTETYFRLTIQIFDLKWERFAFSRLKSVKITESIQFLCKSNYQLNLASDF